MYKYNFDERWRCQMANMRKDNSNVYIDLWGETLEFNKIEYALYQLSTAFEVRVANDIKTIVDKPHLQRYNKQVCEINRCRFISTQHIA